MQQHTQSKWQLMRQADLERREARNQQRERKHEENPKALEFRSLEELEEFTAKAERDRKRIFVEGRRAVRREMDRVKAAIPLWESYREMWRAEVAQGGQFRIWSAESARKAGERIAGLRRTLDVLVGELRGIDRELDTIGKR